MINNHPIITVAKKQIQLIIFTFLSISAFFSNFTNVIYY